MSTFIRKPSLSEKRKRDPWTLKQVIELYGNKSYEQLVKEYQEKKKQK